MIEETGIVTHTDGMMAKVSIQKKGTCEGCAVRGVCEPSESGMEIEALNPVHAAAGQTVRVTMKSQAYLRGSIIVYGIPLVAFIAGAILGKNIGESYLDVINSDASAAIFGFISLLITFIIIRFWSVRTETKPEYKPEITAVISEQ